MGTGFPPPGEGAARLHRREDAAGPPAPYDQVVQSQVVTRLTARAAALPPRVQDLALALALVVVNVASVLPYRSQLHPFWAALVLVIAQCVPLAWRRMAARGAHLAGIPRILYDQLAFAYAPLPLANAIAFYTAMVTPPRGPPRGHCPGGDRQHRVPGVARPHPAVRRGRVS